jgi:periplasmic divalent cation tolerance protein|tara:strand:+ start:30 stop:344 length:315 start_codon:yes stop_codon:yes gene_type:complete
MKIIILLTTTNSKNVAERISNKLVDGDISPCVQISSPKKSIYKWKNTLEISEEYMLYVKILKKNKDIAKKIILELHNYETPELLEIEGDIINNSYLNWFKENSK